MSKKKHPILFVSAIIILIVALVVLISFDKFILSIYLMLFGAILLFFWSIGAIESEEEKKEKGISPVFASNCTHISGLSSFTAEGEIRIYVDRIHFTVAGTHYELPMERIRSADILTQKQTEYVSTSNMGRIILSGLLFGELGMLISAERAVDDRERTVTEENLVITYEKDGEAEFIVLKNLPCGKVIRELEKLVTLTPRHVKL